MNNLRKLLTYLSLYVLASAFVGILLVVKTDMPFGMGFIIVGLAIGVVDRVFAND